MAPAERQKGAEVPPWGGAIGDKRLAEPCVATRPHWGKLETLALHELRCLCSAKDSVS